MRKIKLFIAVMITSLFLIASESFANEELDLYVNYIYNKFVFIEVDNYNRETLYLKEAQSATVEITLDSGVLFSFIMSSDTPNEMINVEVFDLDDQLVKTISTEQVEIENINDINSSIVLPPANGRVVWIKPDSTGFYKIKITASEESYIAFTIGYESRGF